MNRADGEPGNSKQGTKRNRNEADLTKTDNDLSNSNLLNPETELSPKIVTFLSRVVQLQPPSQGGKLKESKLKEIKKNLEHKVSKSTKNKESGKWQPQNPTQQFFIRS